MTKTDRRPYGNSAGIFGLSSIAKFSMVQCNPFPMTPDGPFFLALGVIPLLCRNLSKHLRKWKLISKIRIRDAAATHRSTGIRERKRNSIDGRPCPFCDAGPILSVETRVLPTNDVDKDEATATGVSGPPHFVDGQNGAYTYREKGRKLVDLFCLNYSNPI